MKTRPSVRKYLSKDRRSCRALWRELTEWHRHIYEDPNIGGPTPEDCFDEHLKKAGADRLWVAVEGKKVVGMAGLVLEGEEGELEPLVVFSSARGRGVGSMLAQAVVEEGRSLGLRFINVRPVARNVPALRFFREQGFQNLGHIELFIDTADRKYKNGPKLFDLEFRH